MADVALAAHFLAYVVIANRRYTDLFEWGQRSVPLSLAAEIQHRLLPGAFTCEAGQFTLAAWLQPAGEIGGDTFDFSLERDTLHVSMTDAMGHTMDAALLATVLVGGLRNARRRGVELAEQARLANDALAEQAGEGQFVTGLLVRIDLASATAGIVNAGHPPPLRLRAGQVEQVHLEADRPFGLQAGGGYRVQALHLEVGDRLMFVTDGMLERDAAGMNIAAILTASIDMHRARRCSTSPRRSSRQAAASYATTPPRCVSIGMAALPATATRLREQTAKRGPIPAQPPRVPHLETATQAGRAPSDQGGNPEEVPWQALQETGATGLEPATSGVTGRRSNQLNYAPGNAAV